MTISTGRVILVGAGPGDAGLLTCRGAEVLSQADVVVYDGLLDTEILSLAPQAEQIYAGKKHSVEGEPLSQETINELLIERAKQGQMVVRLKGGDPFVFGRGAEEALALSRAGIPFQIVPGVSAATAVAAYAGIPLTARGYASTALLVTGHEAAGKNANLDWKQTSMADTVVLFMAWRRLRECVEALMAAGRSATEPAAAIYWGTTAEQRTVVAPLAELPGRVLEKGLRPPTLVVVGSVVNLRDDLSWHESRPLFGKRILVTRALARAGAVKAEIAALGGDTLSVPVTRTVSLSGGEAERLARAVASLPSYDWAIFSSATAVRECFSALDRLELDGRSFGSCRIAAVGPATQAALQARGLRSDCMPARRDGQGIAEALIAGGLPSEAEIFFPRAKSGSDAAVRALEAHGAKVDLVPAYCTETTPEDDPQLALACRKLERVAVHAAVFFAPSQVRAFMERVPNALAILQKCEVLAAIGPSTARVLEDVGLQVQVVPKSPEVKQLVRGIANAARG